MALFILLLQFLSRYKDDIFGKGLKVSVLLEIFSYAMVSLVVLALPVSVLLSSLMTMGNFGQNYELAAMRSSGVSLPRILRPMFLSTIAITIFSFLLSNYVVTKANLKFHSLLYDVKQVKPSFTLQPGHFYSDIDNYVIRITDKDLSKDMLYDVIIYDHTARRGNDRIILADSGKMVVDEESLFMEMTLFHGVSHEMNKALQGNTEVYQNARYYFDTLYYEFDLSGFGINRTPEELFATHQYMLNIQQLSNAKDSINHLRAKLNNQYATQLQTITHVDSFFPDTNVFVGQPQRIVELFPRDKALRIYQKARESCKFALTLTDNAKETVAAEIRSYRDYDIEYHLKFSLPISCLIFLLIGAPLGAIIRKGGIGMPIIVSVVFYLGFYVLMLQGKKMAQEGVVPVWLGVWLPVLVLSPLAMFVLYESTAERKTLEHPAVYRTTQAIRNFFITINPLALLLRVSLVRRTIQASLRFFVSLRTAGRRVQTPHGESPIMERLRKLREQGKPTSAAKSSTEPEESPIERRLREIQARKEREAKLAGAAQEVAAQNTASTAQPRTATTGSVHRQVYTEMYHPGWFTRFLALFGLADASPGLPGETPADRRLRLLREKQQKRGLVVPADILATAQPLAQPEFESEAPADETPIERRLRELRERKAREAAEGGTTVEAKTPEANPEPPEDETPIARRLRELREKKAREAAEEVEKDTPIIPQESGQELVPDEEETPIARRLRELRERKAKEAAEAEKQTAPKVEKHVELPPPGSEAETPIMQRLRELRERKAREAELEGAQKVQESQQEPDSLTMEPVLEWGDLNAVRKEEREKASEPAFEFLFGEDLPPETEAETAEEPITGGLDFLFPDADAGQPELAEPLLTFDFDASEGGLGWDLGEELPSDEVKTPEEPDLEPTSLDWTPEDENTADTKVEQPLADKLNADSGLHFEPVLDEFENAEGPTDENDEAEEEAMEVIPSTLVVVDSEIEADTVHQEESASEAELNEAISQPEAEMEEVLDMESVAELELAGEVEPIPDNLQSIVSTDWKEQVAEEIWEPEILTPEFEPEEVELPKENLPIAELPVAEKEIAEPPIKKSWNEKQVETQEIANQSVEIPAEKQKQDGPWVETIAIGGIKNIAPTAEKGEEKEKKSWIGRVFGGMFGSKSGDLPPEAKVETPIERRLRELREKKDREPGNGDKGK